MCQVVIKLTRAQLLWFPLQELIPPQQLAEWGSPNQSHSTLSLRSQMSIIHHLTSVSLSSYLDFSCLVFNTMHRFQVFQSQVGLFNMYLSCLSFTLLLPAISTSKVALPSHLPFSHFLLQTEDSNPCLFFIVLSPIPRQPSSGQPPQPQLHALLHILGHCNCYYSKEESRSIPCV